MEPRNCKRCGRMFGYISGIPICDNCKKKEEEDFMKVRLYIKENSGANMREVAEVCEVSIEKITRFLREGRLEVREGSNLVLECESCRKAIKSGRLCQECSRHLERDMAQAATGSNREETDGDSKELKSKGGGMKYLRSE